MMSIQATYLDGQCTVRHDVMARVDEASESLELIGLQAPFAIPLQQVRVSPRLGNSVRSLWLPNGAIVETSDQAAVDALARRLGQGARDHVLHQLESRLRYQLAAVTLLLALVTAAVGWGIPFFARFLATAMPARAAHHFGQGALTLLDKLVFRPSRLSSARKLQLAAAFAPLAKAHPDLPLELQLRSGVPMNAMALPDGTVILTDALVEAATRDEQLVGILAHEVGHVYYRHSLSAMLAGSTTALLLAAYVADVTQTSDWALWLPATLFDANYSRDQEFEADGFALSYLEGAGISPYHLADMFRIFERESGKQSGAMDQYFSSHPLTSDRIERFERGR